MRNFLLRLMGRREITCPRCKGTGKNGRGDWCWPCQGTGTQVVSARV